MPEWLALLMAWGLAATASGQDSLLERIAPTERRLARLEGAVSATERASLARALGRHGGAPERLAPVLARMLTTEADPAVHAALVEAATRLAVVRPDPAYGALVPALTDRYAHGAASERPAIARALAVIGGPEALAFLLGQLERDAAARVALAWAPDRAAVLAGLTRAAAEARPADLPPYLEALGALEDPAAAEVLIGVLGRSAELDLAAATALARTGSELGAPALLPRLAVTEDARTLVAILEALAELPAGGDAGIGERTDDPDPEVAAGALVAWAHAAPAAAVPALIAALDGDPRRRAAARRVLETEDDAALVPLAEASLARGDGRLTALDFLARARDGAGLPALAGRSDAALARALAAHRFPEHPAAGAVRRELAEAGELELAALAGARISTDAGEGWAIALAVGPAPGEGVVEAALARAPDAASRAWLHEAARRHALALDAGRLRAELRGLGDAPEDGHAVAAILRLAPRAVGGRPADRRALAQAIARGLRDPRPPVRAAAARAAADAGRTTAGAAVEALLEDPHPAVRLSAAHALLALAPERRPAILARAIVETDPRLAAVLRAVGRGEPLPAGDVLVVETVEHREGPSGAIWLEVRTDDGLFRCLPVSPRGVLVLPDVPGPSAEVSLVL